MGRAYMPFAVDPTLPQVIGTRDDAVIDQLLPRFKHLDQDIGNLIFHEWKSGSHELRDDPFFTGLVDFDDEFGSIAALKRRVLTYFVYGPDAVPLGDDGSEGAQLVLGTYHDLLGMFGASLSNDRWSPIHTGYVSRLAEQVAAAGVPRDEFDLEYDLSHGKWSVPVELPSPWSMAFARFPHDELARLHRLIEPVPARLSEAADRACVAQVVQWFEAALARKRDLVVVRTS